MNSDQADASPHHSDPAASPSTAPLAAYSGDGGGGKSRWWLWLLVAAAVAIGIYLFLPGGRGQSKNDAKAPTPPPVPVVAATAKAGDLGVYLTGLGNVTALNTATVKSRVDGQLMRIDFVEGQMVKEGQVLAELDPRPFQVQLMQAEGQRAKDEAALADAQIDLKRYEVLMQQDAIPRQQLDTQIATVKQDQAAIESDQAQIESAKLNLIYCRITAPISGRVGLRLVDVGNIVHATDTTGIVVINEVQPITVIFTIPADRLPQVLEQTHAGQKLQVEAYDRDMKSKLAVGVLFAIDNQIDQTTGTVRLRAQFPNQDDRLFPSQFVNARLLVSTIENAVLVPAAAIQRSPQATFVYVVGADQTVKTRNVELQLTEGDVTAVRRGVAAGDVVVVDGVDRLRPGLKVAATMADAAPAAPAGQAAPGTTK
jgi:membrane fusion protein, multidrug efflux system